MKEGILTRGAFFFLRLSVPYFGGCDTEMSQARWKNVVGAKKICRT